MKPLMFFLYNFYALEGIRCGTFQSVALNFHLNLRVYCFVVSFSRKQYN